MAKIAVLRVTRQITGEALFVCLLHCAWMSLDMVDMAGPLWGLLLDKSAGIFGKTKRIP